MKLKENFWMTFSNIINLIWFFINLSQGCFSSLTSSVDIVSSTSLFSLDSTKNAFILYSMDHFSNEFIYLCIHRLKLCTKSAKNLKWHFSLCFWKLNCLESNLIFISVLTFKNHNENHGWGHNYMNLHFLCSQIQLNPKLLR